MDHAEQISLFSRLLEILIRHAIRKKTDSAVSNLDRQLMWKPGSKIKAKRILLS